jgi:hypothetical protein
MKMKGFFYSIEIGFGDGIISHQIKVHKTFEVYY